MRESSALRLANLFYNAVGDPAGWSAALTELSREFDASVAHLIWWNKQRNGVQTSLIGGGYRVKAGEELYIDRYGAIDPRRKRVAESPVCAVWTCNQDFDEKFVSNSEIYQDFLIPFAARHCAMSKLADDGEAASTLAILRGQDCGSFEGDELALLSAVIPHIGNAARLHSRLAAAAVAQERLRAVIDHLQWSVFLVDDKGRILECNHAAVELLARSAGLRAVQGILAATDMDQDRRLKDLIASATQAALGHALKTGGALTIRQTAELSMFVTVCPLGATPAERLGSSAATAIVFVRDQHQEEKGSAQLLVELFGLTRAEARLASDLADGLSLEQIAERYQITKNTVRAQARAVFAKTQVSRQAELMRLILRLPPQ